MRRKNFEESGRSISASQTAFIQTPSFALHSLLPSLSRRGVLRCGVLAALAGLLPYLGPIGAQASSTGNAVTSGMTVQRSMRAAPHRLLVHPSAATVAANQTQQFGVADAEGNPVVVHWNVSGIGCLGSACGTIDDQGVYHPPSLLPEPRIVTVEGVLASNPNYSVLAEIRLENADKVEAKVASNKAPAKSAARKIEEAPAPPIAKQSVASRVELPPLPRVVVAAPGIGKVNASRTVPLPPLPNAVAAAPEIGRQNVSRKGELPSLPSAVPATPAVEIKPLEMRNAARSLKPIPLPQPLAAAPVVIESTLEKEKEKDKDNEKEKDKRSLAGASLAPPLPTAASKTPAAPPLDRQSIPKVAASPLPGVVAPAPSVKRTTVARKRDLPPLPRAVEASPTIEIQGISRTVELPPVPKAVAAAPYVVRQSVSMGASATPLPSDLRAIPEVAAANLAGNMPSRPVPQLVASAGPPAVQIAPSKPQLIAAAPVVKQEPERSLLLAMQDTPETAPIRSAASSGGASPGPRQPVTYSNGQLTIDAENLSLAAVLQLVAEKTGAVIDIPPGTGQERIYEHAGPGRAEDVLASLLNGSQFDFVIVGSPQNPNALAQVLLSLQQDAANPLGVHKSDAAPTSSSPALAWKKPPEPDPTAQPLPAPIELKLPTEQLSPEERGDFMKAMFKELREKIQQQQDPQQNPQQ